jgi:aminocarboxymuconate-semialdehyde decarboxylase
MVLAGRGSEPSPGSRARDLWCDSLTYDPDSLALAVTRFGAEHVVLSTDYPFATREVPPGAVLTGLDPALRAAIARSNALPLLDRVRRADA